MKIFIMALRNVKKYWRHYLIVALFTIAGTVLLLAQTMIKDSENNTQRVYNHERYGNWYVKINQEIIDQIMTTEYESYDYYTNDYITKYTKDDWEDLISRAGDYKSTTVYEQGYYNEEVVGYIDPEAYDLFGIQITEGKERSSDQDILVESTLANEYNLHVGDHVNIELEQGNDYIVSGIYTNYNEDMPVILTNYNEGLDAYYYSNNAVVNYDVGFGTYTFSYYANIGGSNVTNQISLDYTLNEYGYDAKESNTTFASTFEKMQTFAQMILLLALVISVLTTTALKRRAKESSLLRGIGATSGQLIKLTIDEMSIVLAFTTIFGYLISYGILRYYGSLKTKVYGFYDYSFSHSLIFYYCLGIIVTIIFITFLPMRSSAIGALTGAFEAPKPKMLEGRESKWVSQTSRVMGKRQLSSYSKLTICLMVFVTFIGIYFITVRAQIASQGREQQTNVSPYKNKYYNQVTFDNKEDLETYYDFFQDEDVIYTLQQKDVDNNTNGTVTKYNEDFVSEFELLEGHLPQNNNEILINDEILVYDHYYASDENEIIQTGNRWIIAVGDYLYMDYYLSPDNSTAYYREKGETEYRSTADYSYCDDYIVVDGVAYIDWINEYDLNDQIVGVYVYPSISSLDTVYYKLSEHEVKFPYDENESVLEVNGQYYTDYYWEDRSYYYRADETEDYQRASSNSNVYWEFIRVNGEIIVDYKSEYDETGKEIGIWTYKNGEVGDTITINQKDYTVCGIIDNRVNISTANADHMRWNETYNMYDNTNIYINEEDYNHLSENESWACYCVFGSEYKDQLISYLYNHFKIENSTMASLYNANTSSSHNIIDVSSFDSTYFLIVVIVGIILCLFLNLNNMLNDIKNYAILHLLGMTREDLIKMHVNMALTMSLRVGILVGIYFIFLMVGFNYIIDILSVIILAAGILIFFMCVYIIPVLYILKGDLLETLMAEE